MLTRAVNTEHNSYLASADDKVAVVSKVLWQGRPIAPSSLVPVLPKVIEKLPTSSGVRATAAQEAGVERMPICETRKSIKRSEEWGVTE